MALIANLDIIIGARTTSAQNKIAAMRRVVDNLRSTLLGAAAAWKAYQIAQDAIRGAADFQRAFLRSTAIVRDLTEAQREQLKLAAIRIDFDPNLAQNAKEAAEGLEFLFLAGQNAEQAIASLRQVSAFATAGSFDMKTATDLATDAQSALGLTVKDTAQNLENLTRVTDGLIAANTVANASAQQYAEALTGDAGPAARLLGIEIEEVLAVMAVYADQGIKGAEASTKFAIASRDLQRAAISNADAFDKAGVSVFDASGEFRKYSLIVADLEKALAGLGDQSRTQQLLDLGLPFKSISALQALVGTSGKIKEYEDRIRSAGGVTDEVARTKIPEFDKATKRLASSFRALNATLGVEALNKFGFALNKLIDFLGTSAGKIVAWIAATALISVAIAAAIKAFRGLIAAYKALIGAQTIQQALSGPKGWAVLAAGAVIAAGAVYAVNEAFEKMNAELDKALGPSGAANLEGALASQLAGFNNVLDDSVNKTKSLEESLKDLMQAGEQLRLSLRTPIEEFTDSVRDFNELFQVHAISAATRERAIRRAFDQLNSGAITTDVTLNQQASVRGSQEEFKSLFEQKLKVTEGKTDEKILTEAIKTTKAVESLVAIERNKKIQETVNIIVSELGWF